MFRRKPREPSLRQLIGRQCNCSRRSVYLLDKKYDFPTNSEIDACVRSVKSTQFNWEHEIHDCDNIALEFLTSSKTWFRAKEMNVTSAFILHRATSLQKAHAFNFFVRKNDYKLIFIDNFKRVPLAGRAYLVVM